ncbi:MAG: AbrB/MazE/SpoVT family DNA-binding domain-containing protein [Spirochaetaceae bacterium]|nr:AbrB/MazE/SpoVT family DNA-binding domain-containing protein [Spirochaetaceae bacterium]
MKTTISEKGQITISKQIRNRLGIIPGTILEIDRKKWRGAGCIPGSSATVDEYINEVRE